LVVPAGPVKLATVLDIGEFSQSLNQNQLRGLRASRCRKTGKFIAHSETTIRRVLQRLDPAQLDSIVNDWLRSHLQNLGIAALVVEEKQADYRIVVKANQPKLFDKLARLARVPEGVFFPPDTTGGRYQL
jgi:hypothetical protein